MKTQQNRNYRWHLVSPSRACTSTGVPCEGVMVKKVPTFFPFTMLMMAFSSQPLQITTDVPFFSAHVAAFTYHTNHCTDWSPCPSMIRLPSLSIRKFVSPPCQSENLSPLPVNQKRFGASSLCCPYHPHPCVWSLHSLSTERSNNNLNYCP